MENLQINITKADTGQLITRYQAFEGSSVVYNRIDVYANVNALCRGLKKVFGAMEVIENKNFDVEAEIARLRKEVRDLEDNTVNDDKK